VAVLLAGLPPPENSQNSGCFSSPSVPSSAPVLYFDLQNTHLSNIYDLPIKEFPREYSCVFTLPDGYNHFLQSNNETILNDEIEEKNLLKTVILSENLLGIGEAALSGALLPSISIPDSVTTIAPNAFQNAQITNITFSENSELTSIGAHAFERAQITSITLPDLVTTIGDYAFSCSKLGSIKFSENSQLETIGQWAFSETPITAITFPNSLITIDDFAFFCSQLTDVTLSKDSHLKRIGSWAFEFAPLNNFKIPDYVEEEQEKDPYDIFMIYTPITMPNSVEEIGDFAFAYTNTIYIRASKDSKLRSIGEWAFSYSPSNYAIIPPLVEEIKAGTFYESRYGMNYLVFLENSKLKSIACNVIGGEWTHNLTIAIPNSIETVGWEALSTYYGLRRIKIICQTPNSNNIVETFNTLLNSGTTFSNIEAFQISLSSSLVESFNPADDNKELKDYVQGILSVYPTDDTTINKIFEKKLRYYVYTEHAVLLDLSNTPLTQDDVAEMMPRTISWLIKTSEQWVIYPAQQ
jgi:hypothetical protein